jgi:CDP-diacylglycerol--glycerol-3-phosphate 3-phosphatidyltransferase
MTENVFQNAKRVTVSDRILAATFLRLFPPFIVPNHLTIARFLMTPFVLFLLFTGSFISGTVLFAIAAFTDALDGAMARTRNQITEWGKAYDPLADKLLIVLTGFLLIPKFLGAQLLFAIVLIEMIFIASAYFLKNRGGEVQANAWGKAKMICQSFGVGLILLFIIVHAPILLVVAELLLYTSLVFAIISLVTFGI